MPRYATRRMSDREFNELCQTEFNRTNRPHINTMRRLALRAGKPVLFVKNWFKQKRRHPADPVYLSPRGMPIPPPQSQSASSAQSASPFTRPQSPFSRPASPFWVPNYGSMGPHPPMPVNFMQRQQLGIPHRVAVTNDVGDTFSITNVPGKFAVVDGQWTDIPAKIHIVTPQNKLCYPASLVTEFSQNQSSNDISSQDEAIFNRVLIAKMKCGICSAGLMTLRCSSCSKGICSECVCNLARGPSGVRLQCPYCRAEDTFAKVAFPRM